ncbi:NAD(P)H oxidoreductase [Streptomyces sp. NPDC057367]|uniref:NAD(P)H oxidoreductase n=1 Tax=Streptomyces sp. NPDC057367 TaxID=3346108 RepID=UPI0036448760
MGGTTESSAACAAVTAGSGRALIVVAHPRPDSLTGAVADRARAALAGTGRAVDVLDLHAEGFDPRMTTADEPDWNDPSKEYSPRTRAGMRRLAEADSVVVVFPVWWFGLPAILKGWVDRIWNHGFAYGARGGGTRLSGKRLLWLPLSAYTAASFAELGWTDHITRTLDVGIAEYCGITDSTVHVLHDSLGDPRGVLASADAALATFTHPTVDAPRSPHGAQVRAAAPAPNTPKGPPDDDP